MRGKAGRFGLRALIQPLTRERFEREHWLRRPLVSHGSLARFGALSRIPELQDVGRLCETTRGPVTVFVRKGRQIDLETGADAFPFYDDGETLYFRRLQDSIPALADLSALLARDFGVWPEDVAVEGFASRDGAGTGMHFDSEQNFNIQLRGRKTWRVAENESVGDPMQSFVAGKQPPPFELESYSAKPFPARMPKTARVIEMRAGSALYLPRGYWHETRVAGDSFALCFAVKPPVWAAVLLDALRRRLVRDPAWRQGVFGLAGRPRRRSELRRALAARLPAFAELAASLDAETIVPKAAPPGAAYRWLPGSRRRLESSEGGSSERWVLSVRARGEEPVQVELDDEYLPVMRWMLRQSRRFRPPYGDPEFAELPAEKMEALFLSLATIGLIQPR